jgi:hypothetical protein
MSNQEELNKYFEDLMVIDDTCTGKVLSAQKENVNENQMKMTHEIAFIKNNKRKFESLSTNDSPRPTKRHCVSVIRFNGKTTHNYLHPNNSIPTQRSRFVTAIILENGIPVPTRNQKLQVCKKPNVNMLMNQPIIGKTIDARSNIPKPSMINHPIHNLPFKKRSFINFINICNE